jgi:quinol monooxygenase YgiN
MGVFFVQKRAPFQHFPLDKKAFAAAGQLFEARDEEIGESYFFLPYLSHKEVESKNRILQRLEIGMELVPSSKGVLWQHAEKETSDLQGREEILSFLFGLVMLFGKIESKGVQCNSIKIHLPLFGQYLQIAETLENLLQQLQKEGIFLQSSTNEHQGQISYQITSNDWELLELFAEWYKDIEKLTKITKKEFVSEAVQQLEAFLQQQQIEQAEEIQELLRKSTVKVLVKT